MSETTVASPSGFFTTSLFKSVQITKAAKPRVVIPDDLAADLANVPAMLATMPNTQRLNFDSPEIPSVEAATLLRAQLTQFAEDNGLTLNMPTHKPAHWSRQDADPSTAFEEPDVTEAGEPVLDSDGNPVISRYAYVTKNGAPVNDKDGKPITARWIKDNGVNPAWNVGMNVNFRMTKPKVKESSKNGEVTVTQGTPRGARARSRGNQIINR